ncbi:unnamed protein product [Clavelina lepadiformis]|uniref:Palmitoyltransferase n=1 Tax=Clavelina lepadiformis TaxID=159417 RepID=A0ABP0G3M8_CLALP
METFFGTYSVIKRSWKYTGLCVKSLTYNVFDSTIESIFAPLFCFVDFATRWFGIVFVFIVSALITSVVTIFFLCIVPFILVTYHPLYLSLHLFYGHYLLMMIVFHYYKATSTKPGNPPKILSGVSVISICKKCILPRPLRTHHCNVCKICCLKMDHHCPWINNCVGYFNHRYFISFCMFMCFGTIYVSFTSWPLFYDCYHVKEKFLRFQATLYFLFDWKSDTQSGFLKGVITVDTNGKSFCSDSNGKYSTSIVYVWILCSAVSLALGCLTLWHVFLISRGETSIEKLLNQKERNRLRKQKKNFRNPFNKGFVDNWKEMLGFHDYRSFVFHVLLPSSHVPNGDGINWPCKHRPMFVA